MIHSLSDCQCSTIPESTNVWQYCVVLPNATIGADCNIWSFCFIESGAVIRNRCTIKCGIQILDGIELEDDVFVRANVIFTNDKFSRFHNHHACQVLKSKVRKGETLGAESLIQSGLFIDTGSVVTQVVPVGEVWAVNLAKRSMGVILTTKNWRVAV